MQEQLTIEQVELKIPTTLKALVEALIFAAQEPLSFSQIRVIYQDAIMYNDISNQIELETIRQIVADLNSQVPRKMIAPIAL